MHNYCRASCELVTLRRPENSAYCIVLNYLAHIYLSGANEEILVGNFIGDYVKGFELGRYSDLVRKGIILHRHIDSFTDTNLIVRRSKARIA